MEKQTESTPASVNPEITAAEKPLPKITVFTDWCKQCGHLCRFLPPSRCWLWIKTAGFLPNTRKNALPVTCANSAARILP